jgi:hypothetical protein
LNRISFEGSSIDDLLILDERETAHFKALYQSYKKEEQTREFPFISKRDAEFNSENKIYVFTSQI